MLIQQLHILLIVHYLNMFILQLVFIFIPLEWKVGIIKRSEEVRANKTQQMINIS